ncbi:hypothetical protein SAMN05192529_109131 [Arachidicoccus rhizosphaerae]|uniref:histidine kinase n=1 Tax=Arachidicoccus rhizosphaerae TaxID=551991 RepID=A0A1H3YZM2_9BACT|nr:histidine kinase dimerization/phospho-acceptor domain-containing protein [Arachidicoccus rhizosphaerae]SEA16542.1 hypothetical protein SAMN05192529_109131 [Arachidicoccus rhizosphaerae]
MLDLQRTDQSDNELKVVKAMQYVLDILQLIWPDRIALFLIRQVDLMEKPGGIKPEFKVIGSPSMQLNTIDYKVLYEFCSELTQPFFYADNTDAAFLPGLMAILPLGLNAGSGKTDLNLNEHIFKQKDEGDFLNFFCLMAKDGDSLKLTENESDIIFNFLNLIGCFQKLDDYTFKLKAFRHDLRTPLTSVSMISGLLQQEPENSEFYELGKMLKSATGKIEGLINDFKADIES